MSTELILFPELETSAPVAHHPKPKGPARPRVEAEHFEFDFNDEAAAFELKLRDQYARNKAEQDAYWGPDRYVIHWVCGCHDRDWWDNLPEYERNKWRQWHAAEQERVDHGGKMNTAAYVSAMAEESYQHTKRLAESWAEDLRKAFLEGRPCPIKPVPGLLGTESVLSWAFQLSQVNPASLAAVEKASATSPQS